MFDLHVCVFQLPPAKKNSTHVIRNISIPLPINYQLYMVQIKRLTYDNNFCVDLTLK